MGLVNTHLTKVNNREEKIVNTNYLDGAPINLWNNTIYKLSGASHLVNIDAPAAFNDLTAKFAQEVFTTGGYEKQN